MLLAEVWTLKVHSSVKVTSKIKKLLTMGAWPGNATESSTKTGLIGNELGTQQMSLCHCRNMLVVVY